MCVIHVSYTCSQPNSDGSVLKQSHQSSAGYKYTIWHIDEKLFKDWSQSSRDSEAVM